MFDYATIPGPLLSGLRTYLHCGVKPGSFLTAVLCNDLFGALNRAHAESIGALPALAALIFNTLPIMAYGSPGTVEAWCSLPRDARDIITGPLREHRLLFDPRCPHPAIEGGAR